MTDIELGQHYPVKVENLPDSWAVAYVGDFAETVQSGFACGKHGRGEDGVPHLRPMNVSRAGQIDLSDVKTVEPTFNDRRLRVGDVLFNNTNSPELVGKTAVVGDNAHGLAFSNHMTQVQFSDGISSKFAALQLHHLWSQKYFLHKCVKHVNQASISATELSNRIPFVCPPTNEQHRIVEKIEAMFDEVDKGVESLKTARTTLGLYRQSLLKSAFEGRLTAHWRAQNADRLEAPETLLARIQSERDARYTAALDAWQETLEAWRADGENGKKPSKPKRPKAFPDELQNLGIELQELPHGWIWAQLGLCSSGPEYGTAAKSAATGTVPVVRMGNLQRGQIDWGNLAFTSDPDEIRQYSLRSGDVLFNRTNSPELVGKTSIYKGERAALFAGYLVRVNQIEEIASGPYLNYFLNSPFAKEFGKSVKTDGVNQSNINATKLQEYPFPFCLPAEQAEIAQILDARLESAAALEAEIDAALARADALRQSILKKAFSGQLVPQAHSDEPAAVLLERIKAERTALPKTKKMRKASA